MRSHLTLKGSFVPPFRATCDRRSSRCLATKSAMAPCGCVPDASVTKRGSVGRWAVRSTRMRRLSSGLPLGRRRPPCLRRSSVPMATGKSRLTSNDSRRALFPAMSCPICIRGIGGGCQANFRESPAAPRMRPATPPPLPSSLHQARVHGRVTPRASRMRAVLGSGAALLTPARCSPHDQDVRHTVKSMATAAWIGTLSDPFNSRPGSDHQV